MDRKLTLTANLVIAALCAGSGLPALAGPNDFFGTSVPESAQPPASQARQAPANPYADPTVPQGDYTADEKRMQKKYKASVQHCKNLIAKGTRMMEIGEKGKKDKEFKKGKILKEIGEKQLAELAANNPLSDILDDKGADRKPKTATTETTSTQ
jgi:hypothetical protein